MQAEGALSLVLAYQRETLTHASSPLCQQIPLRKIPCPIPAMSSKIQPFWLFAQELKRLHNLQDMEQARQVADTLWPELTEEKRFFYRQVSKGTVADDAKAAYLSARRSALASARPGSPEHTEILRVKVSVSDQETARLKKVIAQLREDQRLANERANKEIAHLTSQLQQLRAASPTESASTSTGSS